MLKFRRAPSPAEDSARSANHDPFFDWSGPPTPRTFAETPGARRLAALGSAQPRPFVRRRLSPEGGRALEILGHAIEYLADEYANDLADKGRLGSTDPRVAAIQILKELNRAIYYSGTEVQPALGRMKRWLLGSRTMLR
jgi:hypothetical protein